MDGIPSDHAIQPAQPTDGDDTSGGKRLLVDGTALPESKRAKIDGGESADTGPDNVLIPSGTSETTRKPKKGEQNEKNKGRRRGTRPQADNPDQPRAPRLPKRQCAVLIGFSGTNYAGMQIQPSVRTIEGVLFEAFVKSGAVSEENSDDPAKVSLARAARTDAGVHAAGNVVNMKLITSPPGVNDLVAVVNSNLPPDIRVWDILRVQNSFNSRSSCDSRKYIYFFPTYLIIPPRPGSGLFYSLRKQNGEPPAHRFWDSLDQTSGETISGETPPETKLSARLEELQHKRAWRIGGAELDALRASVKHFEGTHNFHNFTVNKDFRDRSNQRHMKVIQVADPVVHGETEWISVLLHGQSFMLHQIRKMMALLVLSVRTGTPPTVIDQMYGPRGVMIPKMPALGLLLEYPVFESYDKKITAANERVRDPNSEHRQSIDFEVHREKIEKFKNDHIYTRMRAIEEKQAVFDAWIHIIDAYTGQDLLYLNHHGKIPPESVIKKGERRANPFKERKQFDSTDFVGGATPSSLPLLDVDPGEEGEMGEEQTEEMEG